ncbi:hypothetical protein NL676_034502 [Syzygium grande]|nr:hypothetical protein NL676_034502 [Syzygium grande]
MFSLLHSFIKHIPSRTRVLQKRARETARLTLVVQGQRRKRCSGVSGHVLHTGRNGSASNSGGITNESGVVDQRLAGEVPHGVMGPTETTQFRFASSSGLTLIVGNYWLFAGGLQGHLVGADGELGPTSSGTAFPSGQRLSKSSLVGATVAIGV